MGCSAIAKTFVAFRVLIFVLGLFIFISMFPGKCVGQLYKNLVIDPNSAGYDFWLEPPSPIYIKFHLFNITNPEDVEKNQSKPILEELGPYVYRVYRKKYLVTFNNDNDTVSYRVQKSYEYQPELSVGSLDDVITTLNVPVLSSAYAQRKVSWLMRSAVNFILTSIHETVLVTTTVNKFLFEGTESAILKYIKSTKSVTDDSVTFDKFGWFLGKNGSNDGRWEVHTGKDDVNKMGEVASLNYIREASCWADNCGKISGSTGEQFNPTRSKSEPITFYVPDFKRSFSLEYESDVDLNGTIAYRYSSTPNLFANGTYNHDNACYDPPEGIPTGVLDMSACSMGNPVFLSLPHFLYADESYGDAVEGLDPQPEQHTTSFFINPTFGVPVKMAARLQFNVLLTPVKGIRLFENVPKILIPMLWMEQTATLKEEIEWRVKIATEAIPLQDDFLIEDLLFISVILFI